MSSKKDNSFTIMHEINVRNEKIKVIRAEYVGQTETMNVEYQGIPRSVFKIPYERESYFEFVDKIEDIILLHVEDYEKSEIKSIINKLKVKRKVEH